MSKKIKLSSYVFLISLFILVLYQYPFFKFVLTTSNSKSLNGVLLLLSLAVASVLANALIFYIILYLLGNVGKWLIAILFNIGAIAVYFINSYSVIIDSTMIGNVLNTNYEEASSFFSFGVLFYILLLGVLPSFLLFKFEVIRRPKLKRFLVHTLSIIILLGIIVFANSANWLWIDKNSKTLGGLVMPWSCIINTIRHYNHLNEKNKKQILLPNARIKNDEKSVVVLVIGESARSSNFSLYGYEKNTNPLLSQIEGLKHFKSESCATYTTAGLKCILEHKNTSKLYEILPNYLYRNDIEVIWKTTNWGEPTITIENYENRNQLRKNCVTNCDYDEILLTGLKEQIQSSKKSKILIVLHTNTSHGPTYYKKYPKQFEKFTPVCKSVELADCTQQELINAYDNTILYTDYFLATVIDELKQLNDYTATMMYVSDHGESLGESNLYMHGMPASIAPKEQLEIPFLIWLPEGSKKLKEKKELSQHNVFHSVLDFLAVESPIYDEQMSIFE